MTLTHKMRQQHILIFQKGVGDGGSNNTH
jgi:hypothetical protein